MRRSAQGTNAGGRLMVERTNTFCRFNFKGELGALTFTDMTYRMNCHTGSNKFLRKVLTPVMLLSYCV